MPEIKTNERVDKRKRQFYSTDEAYVEAVEIDDVKIKKVSKQKNEKIKIKGKDYEIIRDENGEYVSLA